MVECGGLENRFAGSTGNQGSNPCPSARSANVPATGTFLCFGDIAWIRIACIRRPECAWWFNVISNRLHQGTRLRLVVQRDFDPKTKIRTIIHAMDSSDCGFRTRSGCNRLRDQEFSSLVFGDGDKRSPKTTIRRIRGLQFLPDCCFRTVRIVIRLVPRDAGCERPDGNFVERKYRLAQAAGVG